MQPVRSSVAVFTAIVTLTVGGFAGPVWKPILRPARNRRFLHMSTAALIAVAILVFPIAGGGGRGSGHFVSAAHAESNVEKDIHRFKENVKSLIERWRGNMPKGIAGTNGRFEATEIDVSPKYAGRLESVMVDEGDDVKRGQVIARIDSPEY